MNYIIISNRIGKPGERFEPKPGTNVQALLDGGFIAKASTPKPKAPSKVKKATKE